MILLRTLAAAAIVAAVMPAAHAAGDACPFTAEYLSAQLGVTFKPGVSEPGAFGKACRYVSKDVTLWADAGPNPAPTADAWRKMSNPPGTTFKPVPNDPDKAVIIIPKADVSPFPSVSYERKGWLVDIKAMGVSGAAAIDTWNAKLLKLNRLP